MYHSAGRLTRCSLDLNTRQQGVVMTFRVAALAAPVVGLSILLHATPATGTSIEIDNLTLSTVLTLATPSGLDTFVLSGPAQFWVYIGAAGEADDSDFDGRDDVAMELASLNLTGVSAVFGPVTLALNPGVPTTGTIEELLNSTPGILDTPPFGTGTSDFIFDLFFRLDVASLTIDNTSPVHVAMIVSHKPPPDFSLPSFQVACGTSLPAGKSLEVSCQPAASAPEPASLLLLASGLAGIACRLRLRQPPR